MLKRISLLMLVAMGIPLCALAAGERPWMVVSGGGGRYAMTQLNNEIKIYNDTYANSPHFKTVDQGAAWGLTAGCELANHWSIGAGLDRLMAITKASDASGALEYNLAANAWRVFAEYGLQPSGYSSVRFGVGTGAIAESGQLTASAPNEAPLKDHVGGSGALFEAYGGGDFWVTPMVAVQSVAGYRYAKIKEMNISGGSVISANGEPVGLDFSGPYVRLGVKLVAKSSN